MSRIYANQGDLIDYFPDGVDVPDEPEATRKITRASERVDRALLTAVYDVDDDGMPTDTDVIKALKLATCAQVLDWTESDDELGMIGRYGSATAGRITIGGRSGSSGSSPTTDLCAQAVIHLGLAGLLPGYITSY